MENVKRETQSLDRPDFAKMMGIWEDRKNGRLEDWKSGRNNEEVAGNNIVGLRNLSDD
jgi:hypothetical protein